VLATKEGMKLKRSPSRHHSSKCRWLNSTKGPLNRPKFALGKWITLHQVKNSLNYFCFVSLRWHIVTFLHNTVLSFGPTIQPL